MAHKVAKCEKTKDFNGSLEADFSQGQTTATEHFVPSDHR